MRSSFMYITSCRILWPEKGKLCALRLAKKSPILYNKKNTKALSKDEMFDCGNRLEATGLVCRTPVSRDTRTGRYALITVMGPCGAALSVARKCPKRSRRGVSNSPLLHLPTPTPQAPEGSQQGVPRQERHQRSAAGNVPDVVCSSYNRLPQVRFLNKGAFLCTNF